ncbi:hypothetical protein SERLA73DRAFT_71180 [Serpula lacrymans var. lacrymans S7.3]|uniref:SCP domain-containing protein n=2 Tax=Serpula lacrymans var. lacrymans TaxID=341189 RepID=F8PPF1_SERL3|nr:uncharacterized protein SERLADRAFT_461481 [Serpula lacrymans var. lacrymans S7.9]EGO02028.1 hypothetical protein SERLA73DRAFT_71180 [Serpula lacrymans var. lacrymans S7.3]EGO27652.1 hypothetical protein SERLADRAFT_461481 [Serpula lacrymans var. lacrymans S7.9]
MFWFLLVSAVLGLLSTTNAASAYDIDTDSTLLYLYAHNVYRAGYNASQLTWSTDLASKAQQWASSCQFKHINSELGPYGENIAAGTGFFSIINAMEMFTQDQSSFNPLSPSFSDFTQVVWQSTTQLGCAMAQCGDIFPSSYGNALLHVCLYNPPGNIIGELQSNVIF